MCFRCGSYHGNEAVTMETVLGAIDNYLKMTIVLLNNIDGPGTFQLIKT